MFWSDRDGSWDIFKQTLDKDDTAELLPSRTRTEVVFQFQS